MSRYQTKNRFGCWESFTDAEPATDGCDPSGPTVDRDYNIDCTIAAIDAGWVRCATREDPFKGKPSDLWYNLGHMASVTSLETEK